VIALLDLLTGVLQFGGNPSRGDSAKESEQILTGEADHLHHPTDCDVARR
jgi:hypothetical protein